MELVVVGLSHHTAPLALRESLALSPDEVPVALHGLVTEGGLAEVAVLSTCNRTEIYGRLRGPGDPSATTRALETLRPGVTQHVARHGYVLAGDDAVGHLFRVVAGLDSMVLGEHEIAGQVSRAYGVACSAGTAGPLLHRAIPRALQVGRRVRTETSLSRGVASVAGAAVEIAGRVFRDLSTCRVVGVGAGETVTTALRALRGKATGPLTVLNRTVEKAQALAAELGGAAGPLGDIPQTVASADILVAATDAPEPLVRARDVAPLLRRRKERPLLVLDLGVPRDVDPLLRDERGVYVYDLDDLQQIAERGRSSRHESVPRAEAIVAAAVTEFRRRRASLEAQPAIRALLDELLEFRREAIEGDRLLDGGQREAVERVTGRMVDRLLRRLAPRMKDGTIEPADLLTVFGVEPPTGGGTGEEDDG